MWNAKLKFTFLVGPFTALGLILLSPQTAVAFCTFFGCATESLSETGTTFQETSYNFEIANESDSVVSFVINDETFRLEPGYYKSFSYKKTWSSSTGGYKEYPEPKLWLNGRGYEVGTSKNYYINYNSERTLELRNVSIAQERREQQQRMEQEAQASKIRQQRLEQELQQRRMEQERLQRLRLQDEERRAQQQRDEAQQQRDEMAKAQLIVSGVEVVGKLLDRLFTRGQSPRQPPPKSLSVAAKPATQADMNLYAAVSGANACIYRSLNVDFDKSAAVAGETITKLLNVRHQSSLQQFPGKVFTHGELRRTSINMAVLKSAELCPKLLPPEVMKKVEALK
jgi:hypothetical protein